MFSPFASAAACPENIGTGRSLVDTSRKASLRSKPIERNASTSASLCKIQNAGFLYFRYINLTGD